jgi:hypothetical protein
LGPPSLAFDSRRAQSLRVNNTCPRSPTHIRSSFEQHNHIHNHHDTSRLSSGPPLLFLLLLFLLMLLLLLLLLHQPTQLLPISHMPNIPHIQQRIPQPRTSMQQRSGARSRPCALRQCGQVGKRAFVPHVPFATAE